MTKELHSVSLNIALKHVNTSTASFYVIFKPSKNRVDNRYCQYEDELGAHVPVTEIIFLKNNTLLCLQVHITTVLHKKVILDGILILLQFKLLKK